MYLVEDRVLVGYPNMLPVAVDLDTAKFSKRYPQDMTAFAYTKENHEKFKMKFFLLSKYKGLSKAELKIRLDIEGVQKHVLGQTW